MALSIVINCGFKNLNPHSYIWLNAVNQNTILYLYNFTLLHTLKSNYSDFFLIKLCYFGIYASFLAISLSSCLRQGTISVALTPSMMIYIRHCISLSHTTECYQLPIYMQIAVVLPYQGNSGQFKTDCLFALENDVQKHLIQPFRFQWGANRAVLRTESILWAC